MKFEGEIADVKELLEKALTDMLGTFPDDGPPPVPKALNEAVERAQKYCAVRLPQFQRSPEAWCCERLLAAKAPSVELEDFTLIRRLGAGTFGQVYAARKEDTMALFALKFIPMEKALNPIGDPTSEFKCLVKCAEQNSPFLCSINYAFKLPRWLVLAMPLYSGGSLQTIIMERGEWGLSKEHMLWVTSSVVAGVAALHEMGMIHR